MRPGTTPTAERKKTFLDALVLTGGNITRSAAVAGVNRQTAYDWRSRSESFAKRWDDAIEEGTADLEEEARRRAYNGVMKKKFEKGQPVIDPATGDQYVEREYSDILMIFLLKVRRPEVYRERLDVNAISAMTVTVQVATVETKLAIDGCIIEDHSQIEGG